MEKGWVNWWLAVLVSLCVAQVAQAGITEVKASQCWPVAPATKPLHTFAGQNIFASIDLPNPVTNGGNATYAVCHFKIPSDYSNGASGNPATVAVEWETDVTDTTNYYCPAVSTIKALPANGSVSDNSTGGVATTYTGTKQQSAGQYKVMSRTISSVQIQNRATLANCAPTDDPVCAGAEGLIWVFWGDCTGPPWSDVNIGGVGSANVLMKRLLITTD